MYNTRPRRRSTASREVSESMTEEQQHSIKAGMSESQSSLPHSFLGGGGDRDGQWCACRAIPANPCTAFPGPTLQRRRSGADRADAPAIRRTNRVQTPLRPEMLRKPNDNPVHGYGVVRTGQVAVIAARVPEISHSCCSTLPTGEMM